ncbi:hypothetical protein EDB85DRAFT_1070096 [Lactarius pseudohatsudake]|nr:hypothetical protein EDB85DRAFT_1070096 [Lactarius pseudohatsudake]
MNFFELPFIIRYNLHLEQLRQAAHPKSQISVFACEGECIVGITRAWLDNYTLPIDTVFHQLAKQVTQKLLPPENHDDPMTFFHPILTTYQDTSYDDMRTAIFPSYFHGKCQQNGVEPHGCPNPNCPVVCGTPGSLVHFYSTLRFIAFKSTRDTLQTLCSPNSDEYKKTEQAVAQAATTTRKSGSKQRRIWMSGDGVEGELAHGAPPRKNFQYMRKREEVRKGFGEIMKQVPVLLEKACGGKPTEDASGLPDCSWEEAMKAYILSFP